MHELYTPLSFINRANIMKDRHISSPKGKSRYLFGLRKGGGHWKGKWKVGVHQALRYSLPSASPRITDNLCLYKAHVPNILFYLEFLPSLQPVVLFGRALPEWWWLSKLPKRREVDFSAALLVVLPQPPCALTHRGEECVWRLPLLAASPGLSLSPPNQSHFLAWGTDISFFTGQGSDPWSKNNRQLLKIKEGENFKTNYMAFVLKCLLMYGKVYHYEIEAL